MRVPKPAYGGYDPTVSRPGIRLLGLVGLGVFLAQAGHLLVYQLQFGSAAQAVQSQGAHAYFPAFAKTSLGLVGMCLLGGLLIIGIARLLPGRPAVVTSSGPSFASLLSVLFTIQLLCFIVQETIESTVAGGGPPSGLSLAMLGSAGQLPVAALAALALKWLAIRFEAALITLGAASSVALGVDPAFPVVFLRPRLAYVPALAVICPTAYIKRGPPAFLRS